MTEANGKAAEGPAPQLVQLPPIIIGPNRVALCAVPPDISPAEGLAVIDGFIHTLAQHVQRRAAADPKNRILIVK